MVPVKDQMKVVCDSKVTTKNMVYPFYSRSRLILGRVDMKSRGSPLTGFGWFGRQRVKFTLCQNVLGTVLQAHLLVMVEE